MAALAASIREVGLLQPVLVRELQDEEETYELIAGERRWRAARRAGLQTIPVLVQVADDVASLEQALVENLHRVDLNALEEAAAYQQLIDEFGLTHEQVATRMGKGRATVTNTLRLLQLPAGAQRALAERTISAGHARALLGTPDRALQEKLVDRIVDEGLTVRAVEELVREGGSELRVVPTRRGAGAEVARDWYYLRYDRPRRVGGAHGTQAPGAGRAGARGPASRPTSTPGSRSTSRTGGAAWWSSSPPSRTSSGSIEPWSVTAASRSSRNCQGAVQLHPQPVHDVVDCHLVHLPEALIAQPSPGSRGPDRGRRRAPLPAVAITGNQSQEASAQRPRASDRAAARAGLPPPRCWRGPPRRARRASASRAARAPTCRAHRHRLRRAPSGTAAWTSSASRRPPGDSSWGPDQKAVRQADVEGLRRSPTNTSTSSSLASLACTASSGWCSSVTRLHPRSGGGGGRR